MSGGYGGGGGNHQQGGGDKLPPVGGDDFPDPGDGNSGSDDHHSEESEEEESGEDEVIEPNSLQVVELEQEVSPLSKLCQSLFLTIQKTVFRMVALKESSPFPATGWSSKIS